VPKGAQALTAIAGSSTRDKAIGEGAAVGTMSRVGPKKLHKEERT
jgi:hypothetical protein